jgi:uncharacterized protein YggU (UPF0235/DUF167 family)|tara:strand:+ start:3937 stop:4236 length:300 start_codon:yes stop_codon:yes gene_type:complete
MQTERASTDLYHWLNDDLILSVEASPGASRTKIDPQPVCLNVRLTEQPTTGRANGQLNKLLSKNFAVGPSSITIEMDANTRDKICRIHKPKKLPDFISQ